MKYLLALSVAFLMACNPNYYPGKKAPRNYMEIGSYGGFSGLRTTYHYYPGTGVFRSESFPSDSVPRIVEVSELPQKEYDLILASLDAMNFEQMESTPPGNMTYFIVLHNNDGDHQLIWKNMDEAVPELVDFYRKYTCELPTDE